MFIDTVSFETAMLLHIAGFDLKVEHSYQVSNEKLNYIIIEELLNSNEYIPAPSYTTAINWLIDVKKMYINIDWDVEFGFWSGSIYDFVSKCISHSCAENSRLNALDKCIQQACRLIIYS